MIGQLQLWSNYLSHNIYRDILQIILQATTLGTAVLGEAIGRIQLLSQNLLL